VIKSFQKEQCFVLEGLFWFQTSCCFAMPEKNEEELSSPRSSKWKWFGELQCNFTVLEIHCWWDNCIL